MMSRRRYLIMLALSMPMITALNLPSLVREQFVAGKPAVPPMLVSISNNAASAAVNRVEMLSVADLNDHKGSRRSDAFTDVELIDQYGKSHRFRDELVRDRIVCIHFFYADCKGTCPGTIEALRRLRERLKEDFSQAEIRLISITLDPVKDTSERLLEYAESREIVPDDGMAEWLFCTGQPEHLELVRRSLGLYDLDPKVDADRSQHAALITIGNDHSDRWTAQPSGLTDDDLYETFLRIVGNTERQRFRTRIVRSMELNRHSSTEGAGPSGSNNLVSQPDGPCCRNPSEYCSLRDSDR